MKKTWIILSTISLGILSANAQSISNLYKSALTTNPSIEQAYAQMKSSQQYENQALGALLPQINIVGDVASSRYINYGKYNDGDYTNSFHQNKNWTIGVELTQTIFNISDWRTLSLEKQVGQEASLTYQYTKEELIYNVASNYMLALEDIANLKSTQVEAKALQSTLKITQEQYKAGTNTIVNVSQAQAQYDEVLAKEITYKNELQNQLNTLYTITGQQVNSLQSLNKALFAPYTITNPKAYIQQAMQNNLSLIVAATKVQESKESSKVANGNFYPTVSLSAELARTNTENPIEEGYEYGITSSNLNQAEVELSLTQPVFNGGILISKSIQANDNYIAALKGLISTQRTITENVNTDVNNINSNYASISAYKAYLKSATIAYKNMLSSYKAGTETLTDLLISQENLYSAKSELISAQYNYLIAQFKLALDTGAINSSYINQLDYILTNPEYVGTI
ncbi:MAG: TolC family protein [Psittacicella sp.]